VKANPRLLALAACALALAAQTAHAHAFLGHAIPAAGSTVKAPPAELDLFFTEGVVPPFCTVTVHGDGQAIATGKLRNGNDKKELVVPLPKLAPGGYTVVWHATAVDTHKTEGGFHFVVAP
jgi:copper resistance protein C